MRRHRLFQAGVTVAGIAAVAAGVLVGTGRAQQAVTPGEWRSYNADLGSTKYSALDQVTSSNVKNLRIVWRHPAVDPALKQKYPKLVGTNYYRATPLMVGGSLYVQNGLGFAQALDAATGNVLWTQEPLTNDLQGLVGAPASRGVAYWRDPGSSSNASSAATTTDTANGGRILSVRRNYLFALSAKTGKPYSDFGDSGKVDLSVGLRPPVTQYTWAGAPLVVRDVVVIGANGQDFPTRKEASPGDVRAYDVRTGKLRWTFNVVPRPGEFGNDTWEDDSWSYTGNTNLWSMISADPDLGYVYLPLSSPTNDWYGGHRRGNNLFSDSLVCVDAQTGKRVWHFQMVHHDLWDYDLPAAPILGDITVNGTRIKAVVQLTKQGFAFVFDRVTGRPVWPIEERPVPQSTVPGEKTSPTQPFPTKPPAFTRQGLTESDLIDFTPELRAEAKSIADQYLRGPLYTPPPIVGEKKGMLQVPSWVGGADWNGGAFDPDTGWLYVPSIQAATISALKEGDPKITDFRYLNPYSAADREIRGPQGLPLLKPPYGTIAAINLNRGELVWNVANGDGPRNHPLLKPLNLPPLGQPGRAAPLLTKTLLFVGEGDPTAAVTPPGGGGTKFRAYDKVKGTVVWETELDAGTTGAPMTYSIAGKQYIVVAIGSTTHAAELVVFGY
jgi:quinoprotein glucose dehydrogenase